MRKLKVFSLLIIAMTVMIFAGSISEPHLSVNAQTTKQTHKKKKHAKKAKKAKKHTKAKHKKVTKKKKIVKKHAKKTTKAKKKTIKKHKKATKTKKKVVKHKKAKKKAPKKSAKKSVKKTTKAKKVVKTTNLIVTNSNKNTDDNYYDSVDGFNYPADEYATQNATDTLNIPSNYLFSFDNNSKKVVQYYNVNKDSITESRKINTFHPNTADVNTKVDINNLTFEQQRQLSQYAADLVNGLRHKLANNYPYTQDLTVTDKALKAANDVAMGYSKNNWNFATKHGHDTAVLNDVFNRYKYRAYGENIAQSLLTSSYIQNQINIANVKESIYGAICAMMFDDADSSWGHTTNFLGLSFDRSAKQEFGVSIDKMGQIHFEIYQ
ncbi:hypothetical protein AKUA2003_00730 [Apilactobacillus kunkeei]|nr:hypothetical protein AKUA2003_00730 [Apilactobacillus kunkeei]CAI2552560.1 hypothetical protein AKUA1001_00730 [Apilactobacillus kunkeei]CAI2800998.1 hypothetical protein AKUA2002_00730 [Apilactobacillus kunkeei]